MKDFKRGNVPRETIDTLTSKSRGIIYITGSQERHAVRMEEKDNNNNDNKLDSYIYIYIWRSVKGRAATEARFSIPFERVPLASSFLSISRSHAGNSERVE